MTRGALLTCGSALVLSALLASAPVSAEGLALLLPVPETATAGVRFDAEAPPPTTPVAPAPVMELVEGGAHWRVETAQGPIHLWRPAGFTAASAGVVVYVHGYYNTADEAWEMHRLATQFRTSGRNALFVVPEAPLDGGEPVRWGSLAELLATVGASGIEVPAGPVVVVGHSGAFRTVSAWLGEPALHEIILLDGLYAGSWPFRAWLKEGAAQEPRRLMLVGLETRRRCRRLASEIRGAVRLPHVPLDPTHLGRHARETSLLVMDSQYAHMALVTEGRVIPLLLGLTHLLRL